MIIIGLEIKTKTRQHGIHTQASIKTIKQEAKLFVNDYNCY